MDLQTPQLNPSELYEKRRTKDAARLRAYNKVLDAIYHRIRTISRLPQGTSYLLYQVPQFIFGIPKMDLQDLTVYLTHQLRHSGFLVRFTPPNLLYISWSHHERAYLTEQSPVMLSMLESSERSQAELERKEREASRLLAPRKSGKKVRIQEPGIHASRYVPPVPSPVGPSRSAMDVVLGRLPTGQALSAPSAGQARQASDYSPNPMFLNSILNPPSTTQQAKAVPDYFK